MSPFSTIPTTTRLTLPSLTIPPSPVLSACVSVTSPSPPPPLVRTRVTEPRRTSFSQSRPRLCVYHVTSQRRQMDGRGVSGGTSPQLWYLYNIQCVQVQSRRCVCGCGPRQTPGQGYVWVRVGAVRARRLNSAVLNRLRYLRKLRISKSLRETEKYTIL